MGNIEERILNLLPKSSRIEQLQPVSLNKNSSSDTRYYIVKLNNQTEPLYKRGDWTAKSIVINDEIQAIQVLRLYNLLIQNGFYHPKTIFSLIKIKNCYTIEALIPAHSPLSSIRETPWKLEILQNLIKQKSSFETNIHSDTYYAFNYGLADAEIYYFDLHILNNPNKPFEITEEKTPALITPIFQYSALIT